MNFDDEVAEEWSPLDQSTEAFDKLLPKLPVRFDIIPKRITFNRRAGPVAICLTRPNRYHDAILLAFAVSIQSSWFNSLKSSTQYHHLTKMQQFVEWINNSGCSTTETNCYAVFKDYEAYRINEERIKASPLRYLRPLLKNGLDAKGLADEDYLYLKSLYRLSPPCRLVDPDPYTLGDWFDLPWIKSLIGERKYLSLESPSRVLSSFRVTVATTLSYLLQMRAEWAKLPAVSWNSDLKAEYKDWCIFWNTQALKQLGTFDSAGEPADEFTRLLCLDLVKPKHLPSLKAVIAERANNGISPRPMFEKTQLQPWSSPVLFHPDYVKAYSNVEELLMAWLVACETVQPADLNKLKKSHYACEYNASGRLIAMQCCYYKGRAGNRQEPAMLLASDPWTKAQHDYLNGLPDSAKLFRFNIGRAMTTPPFSKKVKTVNTPANFIWRLWSSTYLQGQIRRAHKQLNIVPIFLEAALALTKGSENFSSFNWKNRDASAADYKTTVSRPLPVYLFSLAHIKTSAVHAGSDRYRDGDLINHHSHTSTTEKHFYLTDKNKDFVNRAGRITRLVLHDLQKVVYQPSVTSISQAVNDLELRNKVVDATGVQNAKVHSIVAPYYDARPDPDESILIPDTVEQALIYTHSIAQAEKRYQQLLIIRPDWVERTLLPQLEWMTRMLAKMRSAEAAQKQYAKLKHILPPVFDHLLETQE